MWPLKGPFCLKNGVDADPEGAAEGAGAGQVEIGDGNVRGGDGVKGLGQALDPVRIHLTEEYQGHVPAFQWRPPKLRGGRHDPGHRPGQVDKRLGGGAKSYEEAHVPRVCRVSAGPRGRRIVVPWGDN